VHALSVVVAALAARAYGVDASLRLWVSIVPLAVIASALPISINGWGVREATIVALAAPMGVSAPEALLVSLTIGALNMIASLPGALVMLRAR
ncbi:MAG: lysylphosphatidylglycerol synthase domain-containing protein, partial [Burkholderiales bacterium]